MNTASIRDIVTTRKAFEDIDKRLTKLERNIFYPKHLFQINLSQVGASTSLGSSYYGIGLGTSMRFLRMSFITKHSGLTVPDEWAFQFFYQDTGAKFLDPVYFKWSQDGSVVLSKATFPENRFPALRAFTLNASGNSVTNPSFTAYLEVEVYDE